MDDQGRRDRKVRDQYEKMDRSFRKRLDLELGSIVFPLRCRESVIERTIHANRHTAEVSLSGEVFPSEKKSPVSLRSGQGNPSYISLIERLRAFLDLELRIPVTPFAVARLITLSVLVYGCIGAVSVSAEEIRDSVIAVVDPENMIGGNRGCDM